MASGYTPLPDGFSKDFKKCKDVYEKLLLGYDISEDVVKFYGNLDQSTCDMLHLDIYLFAVGFVSKWNEQDLTFIAQEKLNVSTEPVVSLHHVQFWGNDENIRRDSEFESLKRLAPNIPPLFYWTQHILKASDDVPENIKDIAKSSNPAERTIIFINSHGMTDPEGDACVIMPFTSLHNSGQDPGSTLGPCGFHQIDEKGIPIKINKILEALKNVANHVNIVFGTCYAHSGNKVVTNDNVTVDILTSTENERTLGVHYQKSLIAHLFEHDQDTRHNPSSESMPGMNFAHLDLMKHLYYKEGLYVEGLLEERIRQLYDSPPEINPAAHD